jgi:putative tricarboxylic transport membrane protein
MRTLRSADLVTGTLFALLGAMTLVATRWIRGMAGESLDPRTLPSLVGWTLVFIGVGIVASAWRYRGTPINIHWPDHRGRQRLWLTAVALIGYAGLIEPLGFPLITALFVAALAWYLGHYQAWRMVLLGAATGVIVYYVFMEFLGLNFPLGLLEYLL